MPQRTISYSRAVWSPASSPSLQAALEACLGALPDAAQTRLALRTGHAEVRHRASRRHDLRLHIAAWTHDEAMSTVPDVPTGASADLSSVPPGTDWDYLDGDGMVLVAGNHFLSMSSGLRQSTIEQYIRNLLDTCAQQGATGPVLFALNAVANPEVVQRVQQEGVKKIDLNISQYRETTRHAVDRTTIVEDIRSNVIGVLLDFVTRDETREQLRNADNVQARLVISLDRRRPGMTPEEFAPVAEQIAAEEDDGDIKIETTSGHKIRGGELALKKIVEVDAFARTVHHQHAWELMDEYFRELRQLGMLEQ